MQVWTAWTSKYTPQYRWDVNACPCTQVLIYVSLDEADINDDWLRSMVAFQILRVYSANFSKIHQNACRGLTSLRHLLIYGTALKHAPSLTNIRSTLESLNLASNNIASIPPRYFDNCSQINYISLKRNQLPVLPDLFGVAHSVVTLLFRHNQISDIGNLYKYHFRSYK